MNAIRIFVLLAASIFQLSGASAQTALPAGLPPYDQSVIDAGIASNKRLMDDPNFAKSFALNYQIRLYDMYMMGYMKDHNLSKPPVPYSVVKEFIDSGAEVPHAIMLEMLAARFGTIYLLPFIMSELKKYEEKNNIKATAQSKIIAQGPPGTEENFKEINARFAKLEAQIGAAGPSLATDASLSFTKKDFVIIALALISLAVSILALSKKRA